MNLISALLTVLLSCIVGLFCLFCLISELIRVVRILIAYIRHDDETINKLNLR